MGRNAAKELARIVSVITAYLDRAEADTTLSVSYEAIEKATGVSRGHLSRRKDPEIVELVRRVAALKGGRRDGSGAVSEASHEPSHPPGGAAAHAAGTASVLPTEALSTVIQRDLREVGRLQQQWVSRHARGSVEDAPLALYDADDLLRRLRAAVERVRPAVAEWTRRRQMLELEPTRGSPSSSVGVQESYELPILDRLNP